MLKRLKISRSNTIPKCVNWFGYDSTGIEQCSYGCSVVWSAFRKITSHLGRHNQCLSNAVNGRPPWRCDKHRLTLTFIFESPNTNAEGVNWLFGGSAVQSKHSGLLLFQIIITFKTTNKKKFRKLKWFIWLSASFFGWYDKTALPPVLAMNQWIVRDERVSK